MDNKENNNIYEPLKIEVIYFDSEDVILTSEDDFDGEITT